MKWRWWPAGAVRPQQPAKHYRWWPAGQAPPTPRCEQVKRPAHRLSQHRWRQDTSASAAPRYVWRRKHIDTDLNNKQKPADKHNEHIESDISDNPLENQNNSGTSNMQSTLCDFLDDHTISANMFAYIYTPTVFHDYEHQIFKPAAPERSMQYCDDTDEKQNNKHIENSIPNHLQTDEHSSHDKYNNHFKPDVDDANEKQGNERIENSSPNNHNAKRHEKQNLDDKPDHKQITDINHEQQNNEHSAKHTLDTDESDESSDESSATDSAEESSADIIDSLTTAQRIISDRIFYLTDQAEITDECLTELHELTRSSATIERQLHNMQSL